MRMTLHKTPPLLHDVRLLVFTAASVRAGLRWTRTEKAKLSWQRIRLELPIFSPLLRQYHAAKAARSIAKLYDADSLSEDKDKDR